AHRGEVDTYLVGTAGDGHYEQERLPAVVRQQLILGLRGAAIAGNGHLRAVAGMPRECGVDNGMGRRWQAVAQDEVRLVGLPLFECLAQKCLRLWPLREQEDATRVFVESMHNPGTLCFEGVRVCAQPLEYPSGDAGP